MSYVQAASSSSSSSLSFQLPPEIEEQSEEYPDGRRKIHTCYVKEITPRVMEMIVEEVLGNTYLSSAHILRAHAQTQYSVEEIVQINPLITATTNAYEKYIQSLKSLLSDPTIFVPPKINEKSQDKEDSSISSLIFNAQGNYSEVTRDFQKIRINIIKTSYSNDQLEGVSTRMKTIAENHKTLCESLGSLDRGYHTVFVARTEILESEESQHHDWFKQIIKTSLALDKSLEAPRAADREEHQTSSSSSSSSSSQNRPASPKGSGDAPRHVPNKRKMQKEESDEDD